MSARSSGGGVWLGVSSADGDPEVGRNSNGQTYGSAEGVLTESEIPDLVSVYATNGKQGYVRKADITPPERSLDEVRQLPKAATTGSKALIPVYAADGTTVIGGFKFG